MKINLSFEDVTIISNVARLVNVVLAKAPINQARNDYEGNIAKRSYYISPLQILTAFNVRKPSAMQFPQLDLTDIRIISTIEKELNQFGEILNVKIKTIKLQKMRVQERPEVKEFYATNTVYGKSFVAMLESDSLKDILTIESFDFDFTCISKRAECFLRFFKIAGGMSKGGLNQYSWLGLPHFLLGLEDLIVSYFSTHLKQDKSRRFQSKDT